MTKLGARIALVELEDIRSDLAALSDRLERVTAVLGGTIDLRDGRTLSARASENGNHP